jgi:hypothetical protein
MGSISLVIRRASGIIIMINEPMAGPRKANPIPPTIAYMWILIVLKILNVLGEIAVK